MRRFVVLNHIAVIKIVKKRNKQLKQAETFNLTDIDAVSILMQQPFYVNKDIATLATRAEILATQVESCRFSRIL